MDQEMVISPTAYTITVELNPEANTYTGKVHIELQVGQPTNRLRIQSKARISEASCNGLTAVGSVREGITYTLMFHETIEEGTSSLTISFNGRMSSDSETAGIHVSAYNNPEGSEKLVYVTNEIPFYWFPCFDVPDRLSTFQCIASHPRGTTCVTNVPLEEMYLHNDNITSTFSKTPLMPLDQLIMICGEFVSVAGTTKSGKLVRCLCPQTTFSKKKTKRELTFAMKVATRSLDTYEGFYQTEYPLPKLDIISLPNLDKRREEHWGIVLCKNALLMNGIQASWDEGVQTTKHIVHYTSNQFFGHTSKITGVDIIDIQESLAQYIESHITEELLGKPSQVQPSHTHPSSRKYESLITLVSALVGEEKFRACVGEHLRRNSFSSSTLSDFWSGIENTSQSNLPVAEIMTSWVGYQHSVVLDCEYISPVVEHSEERTLSVRQFGVTAKNAITESQHVIVPVFFLTNTRNQSYPPQLLTGPKGDLKLPDCSFFKLNSRQCTPVIVRYTADMLGSLIKNMSLLPEVDQIGLLNDSTSLLQYDLVPQWYPIRVLSAFKYDSKRYPQDLWTAIEQCAKAVRHNQNKQAILKQEHPQVKRRKQTPTL
eukprot:TRINITY_DN1632_c7_g1_i1.p1 TRINITY_DN1632_c7_g1~~TRINITY_DN1632_c7_g1_i1.p1  ORF type:complete len:607 (+),score=77.84 TRINITY_DN1632_c7_g1_i1:25-1821(+)